MSTDPVLLGCLSGVCGENVDLQLFERVTLYKESKGRVCYICLGKHSLFFVTKDIDNLIEDFAELEYILIERAVTDELSRRFFLLQLTYEGGIVKGADKIIIESQHREALIERIGLCWQAEYMFKHFSVKKFPQAKSKKILSLFDQMHGGNKPSGHNIDAFQVQPYKGYSDDPSYRHRGYCFMLREGFKTSTGLKLGSFVHEEGWETIYNTQKVLIPGGIEVNIHVSDAVPIMELERSNTGQDDLRTVATGYTQALTDNLDQFYVMCNNAYNKRMNRTNDIASWDGWEFFIRSKEYAFACVLFRREYIPPLCDITQDIAVLLRCSSKGGMSHNMCEVLLDECRFIADSLASCSDAKEPYLDIIQARLDTLQFTEEGYRWLEGRLGLVPVHKRPLGVKFVLSIVHIIGQDQDMDKDRTILDAEEFHGIEPLKDPNDVWREMMSDAEALLGADEVDSKSKENTMPTGKTRNERRNCWHWRIARYLAYCVDGGIMGDRFTLAKLVYAVGKGSLETNKILKNVVEFLLHTVPRNDWTKSFAGARMPLAQLLQEPKDFEQTIFNERVMRMLLTSGYIATEWRKRSKDTSCDTLLRALLMSETVGIGLRTLICRQILEQSNASQADEDAAKQARILVPALTKVMQSGNLSLTSCATAALVNMTNNRPNTKMLLVSHNGIKLCIEQLKRKDEDLTLYTLFLLVNLTKTPQHRAVLCSVGGIPILVDLLTSCYENTRKNKVLTELASVLGQLCNEEDTRSLLTDGYPVVECFMWVFDAAQANTKLKSKLLFVLRQFCLHGQNKIKVGKHVTPTVIEDLGLATPSFQECAANALLLLIQLAAINSNALMMKDTIDGALETSGLELDRDGKPKKPADPQKAKGRTYDPKLYENVRILKERIREAEYGRV